MHKLTVFLLTLMLCTPAAAKLYKWVDSDGNVTYSERKPPDQQAKELKLRGVSEVSNEQAQQRLEVLRDAAETSRKDREFKQTASTETAERDKRLAENCEISRQNMRILQNASRVQGADGSFLDDKARATRVAKTQKAIDENCN